MIDTDVLIVGSGPAGSASALALSTYGVPNVLVTKYRWLANTPRAHITNQRTFEVLRDLGVEAEAKALAVPQEWMGNTVFCTALAGEELGRIHAWGTRPQRRADYTLASPCEMGDLPQTLMEPILFGNACSRGTRARFDIDYLSLEQDADGVTATVADRLSHETYQIRAKYLIGADGGRSSVAEHIGLPFEGRMGVAGSMNIVFEADLSRYVAHRPSVLYWVVQPGSDIGGIGMGLVRMVRPWNEWLIVWGYDINQPAPELTDDEAIRIVRSLVGDQQVSVKIKSASVWTVNHLYATRYSSGRVFCMGDAVHRHPPSNGLGSNTSIQDAYNLAWKLALVTKGHAAAGILDSYDAERAPIGRQIVTRANKSIEEFGPIFEALGLTGTQDPAQMRANMEARKLATPEAASQREALHRAIAHKDYEFNAHGVEMNQRYVSGCVVPDGTLPPAWVRDPELFYHPTTYPGARLPHVWLQRDGKPVSTLDLVGQGRFTILTGIGGEPWVEAAAAAAADGFVLAAAREKFRASGTAVEILVRDSQSNPNRAASVASDLISAGVSLMLVSSTPETTNPVSDQCELGEVPCLSTVAPWQPWFFTRGGKPDTGFDWTYHFFWGLEDVIAVYTAMWSQLSSNKSVGGLFPNDGDGNAWGDTQRGFPPELARQGFALHDPGRFQDGSDNFTAQITAFKAAATEIVTGVVIPPDWTTFWTQAQQQGFRPKIASVGKALLFPSSMETLGMAGNNLSTEVWWSPRHPYHSSITGQSCSELAAAYTKLSGKQWTQPIGFTHALFELAVDIIVRARTPDDRKSVLDALTATKLDTVVGPIAWGAGSVKNVAKTPLVGGQWRATPNGLFKFDLVITSNASAPNIPATDRMQPIA